MSKILHIEDDPVMLRALSKILQKNNYEVISVSNGKKAIETLENQKDFDLILCNIVLTYHNGLEILSKIRTDSELRHIPVIIISSNGNEDIIRECLSVGADDFIKKPIIAGELIVRIKKLINRGSLNNNHFVTKKKK